MRANPTPLFADLTARPEEHFRICFFGSLLKLIDAVAVGAGSFEKAMERFPFLVGYHNEIAGRVAGRSSIEAERLWCAGLGEWESRAAVHLPLRALRQAAGLDYSELLWVLLAGVVEEDARFGLIFESLQNSPGQRRPFLGFLQHCTTPSSDGPSAADPMARLTQLGALTILNPEAPRSEWLLKFPHAVWDVLRTGCLPVGLPAIRYHASSDALAFDDLILPAAEQRQVAAVPRLLETGGANTVIVRGARHNGRRTVLGAIARALGRGVLEIETGEGPSPAIPAEAGILAALLQTMPVVRTSQVPGEISRLPDLEPSTLPLGVATGMHGGLTGSRAARALVLSLELPAPEERRRLWERSGLSVAAADRDAIVDRFRLTAGNIGRAAQRARAQAALAGRADAQASHVREATRALDLPGLDTLARRLPTVGNLDRLTVSERTREDLEDLARRCRRREALPDALEQTPGGRLNCGVRALFTGPTGTGKTLAARLLAGTLQKDIYRLDLSSVVNKFIGETEKNLSRLFDSAEELDVILLLDEGDALLTRRTDVQTANDRYANLETNFLLQRMESFQGILVITTNARDRIDPAFERRLDVVVEFGAPTAEERWRLWQSHLPDASAIDPHYLAAIAAECELSGGQIHNAVTHATLLALDNDGVVTSEYVEAALRREYRKRGSVCPLRL